MTKGKFKEMMLKNIFSFLKKEMCCNIILTNFRGSFRNKVITPF